MHRRGATKQLCPNRAARRSSEKRHIASASYRATKIGWAGSAFCKKRARLGPVRVPRAVQGEEQRPEQRKQRFESLEQHPLPSGSNSSDEKQRIDLSPGFGHVGTRTGRTADRTIENHPDNVGSALVRHVQGPRCEANGSWKLRLEPAREDPRVIRKGRGRRFAWLR
jgi:hypothetical protein